MKYALCVGINFLDKKAYGGWSGLLYGCVNDATAMEDLASKFGYSTTKLINQEATVENFEKKVRAISAKAQRGDSVFIFQSSHGGQVKDTEFTEQDGLDETLCYYNGQLTDDYIASLFSTFKKGVVVFWASDSCHSATNARAFKNSGVPIYRVKSKPSAVESPFYRHVGEPPVVKCNLIGISGSQDNQYSYDGETNPPHGLFTASFLKLFKEGISYVRLTKLMNIDIGHLQKPTLTIYNGPVLSPYKKIFL